MHGPLNVKVRMKVTKTLN